MKYSMPHATVTIEDADLTELDRKFLNQWARNLGVTFEELLKRMLIAAIAGSHYAEKEPDRLALIRRRK